jgi:hypothetical protein
MKMIFRLIFGTLIFPAILMVDGWKKTVADYRAYIKGVTK